MKLSLTHTPFTLQGTWSSAGAASCTSCAAVRLHPPLSPPSLEAAPHPYPFILCAGHLQSARWRCLYQRVLVLCGCASLPPPLIHHPFEAVSHPNTFSSAQGTYNPSTGNAFSSSCLPCAAVRRYPLLCTHLFGSSSLFTHSSLPLRRAHTIPFKEATVALIAPRALLVHRVHLGLHSACHVRRTISVLRGLLNANPAPRTRSAPPALVCAVLWVAGLLPASPAVLTALLERTLLPRALMPPHRVFSAVQARGVTLALDFAHCVPRCVISPLF